MKVNSNIQGMIAQSILSSNEAKMQNSTQKMSSGYALNRAKDNPAGMAITNRMRAQLKSLDRANKNSKNAVNAIQTADGALNEVQEMLQRMNELAIQAANGTLSTSDREAIQEETDHLGKEITRISKNTKYNSQPLLDGSQALKGFVNSNSSVVSIQGYNERFPNGKYTIDSTLSFDADKKPSVAIILQDTSTSPATAVSAKVDDTTYFYDDFEDPTKITGYATKIKLPEGGELTYTVKEEVSIVESSSVSQNANIEIQGLGGMKIQTGAEQGQEIQVVMPEVSLKTLGFEDLNGKFVLDMTTEKKATYAIEQIDKAISYVNEARSKIGAYQNRIEKTITNLDVTTENLTESYSTIKDLDMAEGMVEYTTLQVLVQAGTTMLAQANEQPQQALQLLQ